MTYSLTVHPKILSGAPTPVVRTPFQVDDLSGEILFPLDVNDDQTFADVARRTFRRPKTAENQVIEKSSVVHPAVNPMALVDEHSQIRFRSLALRLFDLQQETSAYTAVWHRNAVGKDLVAEINDLPAARIRTAKAGQFVIGAFDDKIPQAYIDISAGLVTNIAERYDAAADQILLVLPARFLPQSTQIPRRASILPTYVLKSCDLAHDVSRPLSLRDALPEEFIAFFRLRCDLSNIVWSAKVEPPSYEGLRDWFERELVGNDRDIFLGWTAENKVAGYTYAIYRGEVVRTGVGVCEDMASKGVARELIRMTALKIRDRYATKQVEAWISAQNPASIAAHEAAGYVADQMADEDVLTDDKSLPGNVFRRWVFDV